MNRSFTTFEEIEVWQLSKKMVKSIHSILEYKTRKNDPFLRNHLIRTALSVPSNIAEGYERSGNKELIQFLYIAKGSCGELRSQLYSVLDLGYISEKDFELNRKNLSIISKMLSGWINYLKKSKYKGTKYKDSN